MSVVGKRKTADHNSGRMPPILVPRLTIDVGTAPEKAPLQRPGRKNKVERSVGRAQGQTKNPGCDIEPKNAKAPIKGSNNKSGPERKIDSRPLTPVNLMAEPVEFLQNELGATGIWEYLMMYLPRPTPPPDNPFVLELVSHIRQRDLPQRWEFQLADDSHPTTIEKADNTGGVSDSDTSAALSPTTTTNYPGYQTALPTRVIGRPRMVFIRKADKPTFPIKKKHNSIRQLAARLGAKAVRREVAIYKPSQRVVSERPEETEKQRTTRMTRGSNSSETRWSRPFSQLHEPLQQPTTSKQSAVFRTSESNGTSPSSSSSSLRPSKLRRENRSATAGGGAGGGLKAGGGTLYDALPAENRTGATSPLLSMMAEWEIAPGKIRVEKKEGIFEDIAFSSAYLTEGGAVPVLDGIAFHVVEIPSGGSLRWVVEESRTRLCSVARGIVRVRIQEKEFPIGPNGMWKVREGVACAVANPFHLEAVIHVTTIRKGEL
ncbi:hypothetical protein C7999DRAFT_16265 [Corynascus novoguineensis]|uniref:Uncharacterized protein n=1 Tax=Corynascus novoguineensis TaxID=1126955 RepID=A0AAN7CNR0_9PEZI|nr:hypothetical protein C7999DRAFT_16265 [Corynascus novoguineensis]